MSEETKADCRCTECDREIINRALDLCLYCGAQIPKELQFTSEEIQENEERYMKKVKEAEEARRKRRATSTGVGDYFESF